MSERVKGELRAASMQGDMFLVLPHLPALYDAHVRAYAECCCAGQPAPYWQWVALLWAGDRMSCASITQAILAFGRCGCGW